jgi:hypothetical protein
VLFEVSPELFEAHGRVARWHATPCARRRDKIAGKKRDKFLKSAYDKGERVGRGWIGLCSYKNGKSPAQMLIM